MEFFYKKSLSDLKNKIKFIVFFIIMQLLLIIGIKYIYKDYDLILQILYNNYLKKDYSILIMLLKISNISYLIYIVYYLINQDLIYSRTNIFLRMDNKKWIRSKFWVIISIIFIFKILYLLLTLFLINFNYISEAIILFFKDLIYTFTLINLIFPIVINRNKFILIPSFFIMFILIIFFIKEIKLTLLISVLFIITLAFNFCLLNISKE